MSLLLAGTNSKSNAPHSHLTYEIIYALEGEGVIAVGNQKFEMRHGSILVIPPKAVHHRCTDDKFKEFYFWSDEPISFHGDAAEKALLFRDDVGGILLQLITVLVHRFSEVDKNDTALSLLYRLILELLGEKNAAENGDPIAAEVRRRLLAGYQDPELSLADILAATGYQKDHIRRRFRAIYGMTPSEYLTYLRIENAKRLLQRRRELCLSISQIATACGYYDGLYFSRVFKKATGVSPKDYPLSKE